MNIEDAPEGVGETMWRDWNIQASKSTLDRLQFLIEVMEEYPPQKGNEGLREIRLTLFRKELQGRFLAPDGGQK